MKHGGDAPTGCVAHGTDRTVHFAEPSSSATAINGPQSLRGAGSNPRCSRLARIAMPCRPIGPVTISSSPGCSAAGPGGTGASSSPIPDVLMNN